MLINPQLKINKFSLKSWKFRRFQSSLYLIGLTSLFSLNPVLAHPLVPTVDSPLKTVKLPENRVLSVESIQGVSIRINGNIVNRGDHLQVGDKITTGAESSVSLRVDNQIGLVELAENTTV